VFETWSFTLREAHELREIKIRMLRQLDQRRNNRWLEKIV